MARSFAQQMHQITQALMRDSENAIKRAAMAASQEAILRTPVKTGKAIASWRVGLGRVNRAIRRAPNTPDRETNRSMGATEALIDAANKIKVWKIMTQGDIFITNAVDYVDDLDNGTSRQAPSGMSQFAIAAAQAVLRKARLLKNG